MMITAPGVETGSGSMHPDGDSQAALIPASIQYAASNIPVLKEDCLASRLIGPAAVHALPVVLDVRIPLPGFRFHDLIELEAGRVFKTNWPLAEDLPVAAGETRLFWAEFAVADQQLTVRVTRVA